MGAPYWNANARGVLSGVTRDTGPNEIVRAIIESVGYQTYDLFEAMRHDGLRPKIVKVDGGMVMNNWFSQFLSDINNVKVLRPKIHETTALGASFMAGLKIVVYKSLKSSVIYFGSTSCLIRQGLLYWLRVKLRLRLELDTGSNYFSLLGIKQRS